MSILREYWWLMIILVGSISVVLVFLFFTRFYRGKEEPPRIENESEKDFKSRQSVTLEAKRKAQDELRLLDLERQIMSFAIRRLYEATAEGKISEKERDSLASGYRERMEDIKDTISRSQSVVALHELETTQKEILDLFNERFSNLNLKIEELRSSLDFKPIQEAPAPSPPSTPPATAKKQREPRKRSPPPPPRKTEAEERIDKIKTEIEKVLERLEQIETEV